MVTTLTPRYRPDLSDDKHERYVGGVGRYDLWLRDASLRVVWGERSTDWDTFYFTDGEFYHGEPGRPHAGEVALIIQYLRLFVPEAQHLLESYNGT